MYDLRKCDRMIVVVESAHKVLYQILSETGVKGVIGLKIPVFVIFILCSNDSIALTGSTLSSAEKFISENPVLSTLKLKR